GPASTPSTSTIVSVLVIFGHGSSRRRLRTFLPLHLTIVRVSILFIRYVSASLIFLMNFIDTGLNKLSLLHHHHKSHGYKQTLALFLDRQMDLQFVHHQWNNALVRRQFLHR